MPTVSLLVAGHFADRVLNGAFRLVVSAAGAVWRTAPFCEAARLGVFPDIICSSYRVYT
jgi:hypothetical protein